jgi:uncharacterized protein (DUF58 family)
LGGVFVTRRLALLVVATAPVVVFLPRVWAWVAALGWLAFCATLVRRDLRGAPGAGDLSVERTVPSKFSIGVANRTTLTVQNSSALGARIVGRETPPAGFAGSRGIGPLLLEPRQDAEIELRFVPPARGAYRFGKVGLRSHGPRGLAGRQFDAGSEQDVRVYPDLSAVHGYSLLARRGSLHEIGVRAARYAGVGTDFESLREYIDGDDYRDIDWKATARRGSPVVRKFEAERSQTMVLAIDAGRLMTARVGGMAKLDRAINAALLLAYLATRSGDNVGLLVFGRDVQRYLPPRKGHRQFLAILEALYPIEGRVEEPDYAGALRYLATRLSKRSLVVVFTELVGTEPSRRLLGVLGSLTPRHLPLVITQRNLETEAVAVSMPADESSVYRSVVAQDVLHDKAAALRLLAARGSLVLDVVPERLSVAAVNRYLEIKARGRL